MTRFDQSSMVNIQWIQALNLSLSNSSVHVLSMTYFLYNANNDKMKNKSEA